MAKGRNTFATLCAAAFILAAILLFRPAAMRPSGRGGSDRSAAAGTVRDQAREAREASASSVSNATDVCEVQVSETPTRAVRERIMAAGARVMGVLSRRALLVEADAAARARLARDAAVTSVARRAPGGKMTRRLAERLAAGAGMLDVTVVPCSRDAARSLAAFVRAEGGSLIAGRQTGGLVRATVPRAVVERLAARGDVRRIEPFAHPRLLNDMAADVIGASEVWNVHGLTGRGQIISMSDSGLDTGNPATLMADFSGRVCAIQPADTSLCITSDMMGHGTHTAGSIVGNGAMSEVQIRGIAFGARLWVWGGCPKSEEEQKQDWVYMPDEWDLLFAPDQNHFPSFIHSASWGGDLDTYSADSAAIDEYMWNHPETLALFAAGNSGSSGHRITEQAGAKNVLAVGATQNSRSGSYGWVSGNPSRMAAYSSRGPTRDGRIKPDVCAPGTGILSTRTTMRQEVNLGYGSYSNTNYTFMSGTSMATPIAAGAAALVRQWLVERRGLAFAPPTAALMKAVLTGGAHDMSHDASAICGGGAPNFVQGWGRIDVGETLYPSNRMVRLADRIPFSNGSRYVFRVDTVREAPLDVQLAWTDYPGVESDETTPVLVNDLDLVVSNETTGVVWWGNGVVGGDRTNNVEGVRIASASAAAYTVTVVGHEVPYDSTEGGAAALYLRGAFPKGITATLR